MQPLAHKKLILSCGIYGCGKDIELTDREIADPSLVDCPHCKCPHWPMELGFTGNDPEEVREFARTHKMDGTPIPIK
ncbi:MAG: hypothetical protein Q8P82_02160 [bacterium]|nr:hypothetical protein [bacterium]